MSTWLFWNAMVGISQSKVIVFWFSDCVKKNWFCDNSSVRRNKKSSWTCFLPIRAWESSYWPLLFDSYSKFYSFLKYCSRNGSWPYVWNHQLLFIKTLKATPGRGQASSPHKLSQQGRKQPKIFSIFSGMSWMRYLFSKPWRSCLGRIFACNLKYVKCVPFHSGSHACGCFVMSNGIAMSRVFVFIFRLGVQLKICRVLDRYCFGRYWPHNFWRAVSTLQQRCEFAKQCGNHWGNQWWTIGFQAKGTGVSQVHSKGPAALRWVFAQQFLTEICCTKNIKKHCSRTLKETLCCLNFSMAFMCRIHAPKSSHP